MLLDLESQGSMSIYKDEEKMSVMQAEGLRSALLGVLHLQHSRERPHRVRGGARIADGGGAGGGEGSGNRIGASGAPGGSGVAAHGDRRRVRGGGSRA